MKKISALIMLIGVLSFSKTVNERIDGNKGSFCLGWNDMTVAGGKLKTRFSMCKINGKIYKDYSFSGETEKMDNYPKIDVPDKEKLDSIALIFSGGTVGVDSSSKNIYATYVVLSEISTLISSWDAVSSYLGEDFLKGIEETGVESKK